MFAHYYQISCVFRTIANLGKIQNDTRFKQKKSFIILSQMPTYMSLLRKKNMKGSSMCFCDFLFKFIAIHSEIQSVVMQTYLYPQKRQANLFLYAYYSMVMIITCSTEQFYVARLFFILFSPQWLNFMIAFALEHFFSVHVVRRFFFCSAKLHTNLLIQNIVCNMTVYLPTTSFLHFYNVPCSFARAREKRWWWWKKAMMAIMI